MYRFSDIEIDGEGFRVTRAGEPVRLEPKAVELLLFLAANPGRLVTKAEIQEAVWQDTAVTENALTRLVAQIRKGLGDDAREARYIETVPTRGYRFVAPLDVGAEPAAAPAAAAPPRRRIDQIVFQGQAWTGSTEGTFAAGEGSTLWIVPAAGGEPRAITAVAQTGPGGHGSPAWSPNDRLIAFVAGGRVFVVRPDGSSLRRVAEGPRIDGIVPWINEVAWEADGKTQVWAGQHRFNWSVWRVRVDPETGVAEDGLEVVATGADRTGARRQLSLSPDGKRMAYVTFQTRFEIVEQPVNADGHAAGEPAPAVRGIAGRKQPPLYSPDGRSLAFAVIRPGEGQALWLTDRASGDTRLLVERFEINYASRTWFPDSRNLGFVMREKGGSAFWSVDVETGEVTRRRALPHQMFSVSLSPDGTRLAAHGPKDGVLNVWTAPLDGGDGRALTDDREGMGWPVWSPDSRALAVEIMRGGNTRVGVLPSAGGPVRELTSASGQSWPCAFSPDGRKVAFAGQRAGVWNIHWVPVEGGPEQRVTSYTSPALYVRYCDWSPRGDRIARIRGEHVDGVDDGIGGAVSNLLLPGETFFAGVEAEHTLGA